MIRRAVPSKVQAKVSSKVHIIMSTSYSWDPLKSDDLANSSGAQTRLPNALTSLHTDRVSRYVSRSGSNRGVRMKVVRCDRLPKAWLKRRPHDESSLGKPQVAHIIGCTRQGSVGSFVKHMRDSSITGVLFFVRRHLQNLVSAATGVMHFLIDPPDLSSSYPSPPSNSSSPISRLSSPNGYIMGGSNGNNVDGVGALNYQRAIDIARNTEGELDPTVNEYLERALSDIWGRIQAQPETYVLTKDEFAVFNFFILRFDGLSQAEHAVARYWQNAREPAATRS